MKLLDNQIMFTKIGDKELYEDIRSLSCNLNTIVFRIRCELCSNWNSFFREISAAMQFQSYFAWNVNSYIDCVFDLDYLLDYSRVVIIFDHWSSIFLKSKDEDREKDRNLLFESIQIILDSWISDDDTKHIPLTILINDSGDDY